MGSKDHGRSDDQGARVDLLSGRVAPFQRSVRVQGDELPIERAHVHGPVMPRDRRSEDPGARLVGPGRRGLSRWPEVLAASRMRGVSHEAIGAPRRDARFNRVGYAGRVCQLGEHLLDEATPPFMTNSVPTAFGIRHARGRWPRASTAAGRDRGEGGKCQKKLHAVMQGAGTIPSSIHRRSRLDHQLRSLISLPF